MKAIADTLGVSRSNLIEPVKHNGLVRAAYRKANDAGLLPMLRRIADNRPTYGYQRSGALLHRELVAVDKPPGNHKRLYRIMRQNGLLLVRHTGIGQPRSNHGTAITLRSNSRWFSDVFEIPAGPARCVRSKRGNSTREELLPVRNDEEMNCYFPCYTLGAKWRAGANR